MITIKGLSKKFGKQIVLDKLDVDIHQGEVIALIGSSGAGKSTFLRSLNFLENADAGTIQIDDKLLDVKTASKEDILALRQSLSMVFQQFNLFSRRTVLENVMEGLVQVKKMPLPKAKDLALKELTKVGLADKVDQYPKQLSGGQKQRVGLARALAMKPSVLLLDEPTSALDPELVREVEKAISQAAQDGQTMILVSHDMAFVEQVADRVLFLEKGKIIEEGTSDQIFHHPKQERTKDFLANYRREEAV
ncbi:MULTISPECIES: amino acid ABC transporter ATP-binding protein [unclassified Streptococcus]|uniref:amino acid ABC transporter ATP-binding protein n=1 Tax=unclassified Streptococcus TaxID=2608887 RepID=UPI001072826E|nr:MULTISPECIES: amino acid ABC transporter ATP-binding protein [unclassified Streptococcus]MBF0805537.1 amino acid ABC transporter ATP-binding protein [Streptococcus sp. 19428wA2_WM07]TFU28990.1 amino acid ABC transporter ATP-binding protein [Streptococcus sp. WM07]